jgi:hypothetical protein
MATSRITWWLSRSHVVVAIITLVLAGLAAPVEGRTNATHFCEACMLVFTAQLYGDPEQFSDPNERPVGHFDLYMSKDKGESFLFDVVGIALLTRALAEPYTAVQITDANGVVVMGMGDPEELPSGITVFSVQTTLPAEIVAVMVGDPEEFPVTAFTAVGPVATGVLRFRIPVPPFGR